MSAAPNHELGRLRRYLAYDQGTDLLDAQGLPAALPNRQLIF
jgi:hypothetical protein